MTRLQHVLLITFLALTSILAFYLSSSAPSSQSTTKTVISSSSSNDDVTSSPSSSSFTCSSSSRSHSSSLFSPFLTPKTPSLPTINECKSYSERYSECISIRKQFNVNQRRELFRTVAGMGRDHTIKEVAILRLHKRKWIPDNIRDFESTLFGRKKSDAEDDEKIQTIKKQMDMWLHTCSFIIESARDGDRPRDVVLYTIEGDEHTVPSEFQPLIRPHSESMLHRLYRNQRFYSGGGYQRGDLAAHLFLKTHSQYNFLWLIEYDLRFVGASWGEFLSRSRRYSSQNVKRSAVGMKFQTVAKTRDDLINRIHYNIANNMSDSNTNNIDEKQIEKSFHLPRDYSDGEYFSDARSDAQLIWFYPPLVNYGYMKYNCSLNMTQPGCSKETMQHREAFPQWIFAGRNYFIGNSWRNMFLGNKRWYGAFAPGFGASRTLLESVYGEIDKYASGHTNQEASLAIVAIKYKLKAVPILNSVVNSQFYFTWGRKNESAPYYEGWSPVGKGVIDARTMWNKYLLLKDRDQNYDQRDCLSDFLFHPVKF